jgi:hypothetical protein
MSQAEKAIKREWIFSDLGKRAGSRATHHGRGKIYIKSVFLSLPFSQTYPLLNWPKRKTPKLP